MGGEVRDEEGFCIFKVGRQLVCLRAMESVSFVHDLNFGLFYPFLTRTTDTVDHVHAFCVCQGS